MEKSSLSNGKKNVEKIINLNSSKEEGEELIKREEIQDSPFMVITAEGKSFGVLGNYRITEVMENADAVKEELQKVTWNRITQVMMITNKMFNEKEIK